MIGNVTGINVNVWKKKKKSKLNSQDERMLKVSYVTKTKIRTLTVEV